MKDKNYILRKKLSNSLIVLFRFIIIFGLCYIILKPIVQYFLYACMSPEDFGDYTVSNIPKNWSLYYWKKAAELSDLFGKAGITSFVFALVVAVIQVCTSMVVGYGLARFKFKGKGFLNFMLYVVMLVPSMVLQLPQYFQFRFFGIGNLQINLINTLAPYIVLSFVGLGMKQALYIFLMKLLFQQLPVELENAAYVDGAGVYRTFISVAVPNAKSMIITVFLFAFCWTWTDSSYATAFYPTTPVVGNTLLELGKMVEQGGGTVTYAGVVLMMIPMLILMVVCQKHLIKSIAMSGMAN